RSLRNLLDAAKLDLDAADDAHQENVGPRPPASDLEHRRARHHEGRQRHQRPAQEDDIEQDVEDERTDEDQRHRKPWWSFTSPVGRGRMASSDAIRVRGSSLSIEKRPLTRIAAQSDLSPLGRGERNSRKNRPNHPSSRLSSLAPSKAGSASAGLPA